jgi:glyoxylase-like metal-dependent hydrolase (beta-lactamase superfamily II)
VGRRQAVIIDPGPDVEDHVRALASAVDEAEEVTILLTHGHADHAAAAVPLQSLLGAPILGPEGLAGLDRVVSDGDSLETDEGELTALHTPGHTPEHLSFLLRPGDALFVGDLMLGRGDTTWVAEYPGCVADYLNSLERLRGMSIATVYPAHGPPLEDPAEALDRFESHRLSRIEQVREILDSSPDADLDALVDAVYGDSIPSTMRGPAGRSLEAILDFIRSDPT